MAGTTDPPRADAEDEAVVDAAERRARFGTPLVPLWLAVVLGTASGALLNLAYPPAAVWGIVFAAVPMLLVALVGRSSWGAFLVGLGFGLALYLVLVNWTSRYLGPVPWLALGGLEGILTALATVPIALAYRWLPRRANGRWARLVALPALVAGLWSARELFTGSWPYTGFPWFRIGMSQVNSPLAEVASWVGVTGLTFLVVFLCAAAVELVRIRRRGARRVAPALAPAVVLALVMLVLPQFPTAADGSMRVGSVQGNGPSGYFDQRAPGAILDAQLQATDPLIGKDMDVLLWPEGSVDSDPYANPDTARVLTSLEQRAGVPLIVNAATGRDGKYYNTSILWQHGEPAQSSAKRNPVPFGEYVPDRWFYGALAPDLINLIQREYTPGTDAPLLDVDGTKVGLAICFDVIYDGVVWQGATEGAGLYMFQTNNADFRGTVENLQQLSFARMRAIETGRSVVNISTVGTSQVILPDGTTKEQIGTDVAGTMLTDVPLRTGLTAAVALGPVLQPALFWLPLLAVTALGVLARRASRAPHTR